MSWLGEEMDVRAAWEELHTNDDAVLVDVRTRAEWTFVGVPDLSELGKRLVCVEWMTMFGQQNANFAEQLEQVGVGPESTVLFICRSGHRSADAAAAMAGRVARSINVAGGFEGDLDAYSHRGTANGWKAAGLPWVQS